MTYEIVHTPSGDLAEAEDESAALVAARTLLQDNDDTGRSDVYLDDRCLFSVCPCPRGFNLDTSR